MPMCVSGQTLKTRRDMAKTTSNPMENAVRDLASQVGPWLKWIDGNLHVGIEVRVAVGVENQIVDVSRPATL